MTSFYRSEAGAREVLARYRDWLEQWPVRNEQLRLPTSLGETFVVAYGPKDAAPLVLLHGSASNASMWLGNVPVWAAHQLIGQAERIRDFLLRGRSAS